MKDSRRFKHYTRGGQISFHNLRMWDQITKLLVSICLCLWGFLTLLIAGLHISLESLWQMIIYYLSKGLSLFSLPHTFKLVFHGKVYFQSVGIITSHPYYANNALTVLHHIGRAALIAFWISSVIGVALTTYFIKRGKAQSESLFIRGSKLQPAASVKKKLIQSKQNATLNIDGFPLKAGSEVQHFLIHGTVGTGKSQLMMKLMDTIRAEGDRVIVYDKGCAFIPHYYQANSDIILNPFDARCPNWNLWAEAPSDSDFENMAESLIPLQGESDPFWANAARTVFSTLASKMRHETNRSLEKLLQRLLTDDFSSLESYLKDTSAATLVSSKSEKTSISIRSVITTYLRSLEALRGLDQTTHPPFSVRDYLLNDQQQGWLFISSHGERHTALKPLISMWLTMASITLLSLTPDPERRIWFICDELPSLHKIPLLGETIAEVRKFGGCFVLGMQSFAQLTKVYGQSGAKEIFDLLNTRFFFRSPSSDMARLVSSELGEEEVEESRENYSYGANSIRDGISLSQQRITRPIVTYPEILELPDLTCFIRLPGQYPVTKLALQLNKREKISEGFIERQIKPPQSEIHHSINYLD